MTAVETQEIVFPEVFSATDNVPESASLLGPSGRGMRLRVSREKPRTSGIVELASRRCLVGSAPSCHVRVDEPGVAPIACLILHGAQSNVVRWLDASQGFAGGELFEDEILLAGDPLQIGPVELELLVDEIMSAEEPRGTEEMPEVGEDRLAEYISRLERLEIQLVDLQHLSKLTPSSCDATSLTNGDLKNEVAATIGDLSAQLAALQSRSASDRELWVGERAALEAVLHSRLRDFDFLQDEVQRLRDELVSVRSEFGNRSANEDVGERLAEVSQELVERTEDFEQQRTNWERNCSEFQSQLRQSIERIEQFETQLAQQSKRQAESDAARQAAETRADRLQESVEELSKRLAEQQQDYETVRAAWEIDRASLETELAETKQRLAQSEAAESAVLPLHETWDRERVGVTDGLGEAISRAEEREEKIEDQRGRYHEQHEDLCESRSDDQVMDQPDDAGVRFLDRKISAAPLNPMDRLLAASALVEDQCDEAADPPRNFRALEPIIRADAESESFDNTSPESGYGLTADVASNYYEQAFSSQRSSAYLDELNEDDGTIESPLPDATETSDFGPRLESTEPAIDEVEEVAFEIASSAPPVSTADVLARLGQADEWSDDETVADGSSDAAIASAGDTPNDAFSRLEASEVQEHHSEEPQSRPLSEAPFTLSTPEAANDSGDEDESIEAYMTRLMSRVRGADDRDEPRSQVQPVVERRPITEYTEVTKTPQPELTPQPEKFNPEVYKPHSQAPEVADRMTAMRSLANDSARTAIASHAKRNWSSIMKLRLFVSVFAFGSVLVSLIFFWGDPLLIVLGSLVGIGVLAYWARIAATYRRMLLDSLMLDTEGGDEDSRPDEGAA